MRNSAYEHQIPEQLFASDADEPEGVSTAKAIVLAMEQGQRVYRLTSENASELSNVTIDDGARAEIQQALSLGLEVTVHESPIIVDGWEGSGYAIIDAEYGVGAYKISGGASGAIKKLKSGVGKVIFNLKLIYAAGPHLRLVGPIGSAMLILLDIRQLIKIVEDCGDNINIANAISIFLLITFLAAQIALTLSNPFLAIGLGALKGFVVGKLTDPIFKGLCPP